jgi:ribosomal-protein-serine acetyltransferase
MTNEWAEIGYWIDKDHEGKGIMTESVKALINYGFNELNLHRIQIKCDARNVRSKRIPERLGFKLEGTIRENHKYEEGFSDGLTFGLLKSEWKV